MKRKQGISLIVLVITIIVMIVLAAAVVITLSNTGIINRANVAVKLTDESQVRDLATMVWLDCYMEDLRGEALETKVLTQLAEQGVKVSEYNITVTDSGVKVIANEGRITNLAGTTWKFNEHISGYDFFDVFDYANQTGWDDLPDGCTITNDATTYIVWGFAKSVVFEDVVFGTVHSAGQDNTCAYISTNSIGLEPGWYIVKKEITQKINNNETITAEEIEAGTSPTSKVIVAFSNATNSALMNTEFIDWLYENAKRID